ncbi:Flp pilus assembly protein CpaB [Nocardioides panacisoli]|uniref:Flp pilus assembly protein CpaB n=1 Tax=Nocardioides panacisoli TaxID=627624 RepID=UPI001C62D1C1|nr:Flp pilus assembly protein CpaB [Nocardioides panacisoli]QYJ04722.1 Flp pilus assembly protein CpaB [Nocardioides panacisoli]
MDRRRLLLAVAAVVAALGVLLVFVYAQGAENRAADRYEAVEVLTAAKKINPGESIDAALESGKVELSFVAGNQVLEGASNDADPLQGSVALTTIYPGEQLIPVKFGGVDEIEAAATLPIPEGKIAMSISVEDAARVGSFISPGAEVAVFLTVDGNYSRLLLQRVTVIATGSTSVVPSEGRQENGGNETEQLITVAVKQREVEKLRLSQTLGQLSVGLLNDSSKVERNEGVEPDTIFE